MVRASEQEDAGLNGEGACDSVNRDASASRVTRSSCESVDFSSKGERTSGKRDQASSGPRRDAARRRRRGPVLHTASCEAGGHRDENFGAVLGKGGWRTSRAACVRGFRATGMFVSARSRRGGVESRVERHGLGLCNDVKPVRFGLQDARTLTDTGTAEEVRDLEGGSRGAAHGGGSADGPARGDGLVR